MSNRLEPDQALNFVGPDLGSIFLLRFQQTTLGGKDFVINFSKGHIQEYLCQNNLNLN